MKNSAINTLTVTVTVLFIILLAFLFAVEAMEMKSGKEDASGSFRILQDRVFNSNSNLSDYGISEFEAEYGKLKCFSVFDGSDNLLYFFAASQAYFHPGKTPEAIINNYTDSVFTYTDKENHKLQAVYSVYSSSRLFNLFTRLSVAVFFYILILISLLIASADKEVKETMPEKPEPVDIQETKLGKAGKTGSDLKTDNLENSFKDDIESKLSGELKRSASFDHDLVLILVGSPDNRIFSGSDEFRKKLAAHFPFSDLIFRYSTNIFGIILPNTDLEQGIHQVELFDQKFVANSSEHLKFPIMFGLSSRNGRLISGSIILKEAIMALKKAMSEKGSPIIGFRPNPAKYREYLSKAGK